jgi:hypothetical protein
MKNAFYFTLGIALIVLTSATTVSVMTVKPAKPKSVSVGVLRSKEVKDFTYQYVKKGFQIKTITASNDYGVIVVVMEKY